MIDSRGRPRKNRKRVHPIIETLHNERKNRKLSLAKLSKILGYCDDVIGSWERGDTTKPLQRLTDWAEGLGFELKLEKKS